MPYCVFIFIFSLEPTVREQLDENDFRHYYGIFFRKYHSETILSHFKVLSQQLRNTLITAFERHPTVEDFIDIDQHSSSNKNRRKCLENYRLHNNSSLLFEENCTKTSYLLHSFFPLI